MKLISPLFSNDMISATSWARDWGMLFSAEKSEHLAVHRKRKKQSFAREDVITDGVLVPPVREHKNLGLIIDENLTCTSHLQTVYSATAQRLGVLARPGKRLHLSLQKIFNGFVRHRLEYACALWCGGNY